MPEIARAFLVPETTMAQQITRAKAKIKATRIPYRVPSAEDLPARVGTVLAVLFLIFNEGYLASGDGDPVRADLSAEAIRLARVLHGLLPDQPEVTGLLALMLLTEARRPARVRDGALVVLPDQDRTTWDRVLVVEGATPPSAPTWPDVDTPREPVVTTYHGTAVTDGYQWLEDASSQRTREWTDAQATRTEEWLSALPDREGIRRRLHEILAVESTTYGRPRGAGGRFFALKHQPPKQQPFLVTLDVVGVASGEDVEPPIPRVNSGTSGGSLAWRHDSAGFWYTRHPAPDERPASDLGFFQELWFHEVGAGAWGRRMHGRRRDRVGARLLCDDRGHHRHREAAVGDGHGRRPRGVARLRPLRQSAARRHAA